MRERKEISIDDIDFELQEIENLANEVVTYLSRRSRSLTAIRKKLVRKVFEEAHGEMPELSDGRRGRVDKKA